MNIGYIIGFALMPVVAVLMLSSSYQLFIKRNFGRGMRYLLFAMGFGVIGIIGLAPYFAANAS
jgi:uncharacterized membrane protein